MSSISRAPRVRPVLSFYCSSVSGGLPRPRARRRSRVTWSDDVSRDQSFSRVLIVGISPDFNQRCRFERVMASRIKSAKTEAFVSCDVMPPKAELTRENIEAAVAAKNADAVLATSLISKAWEAKEGGTYDTRGTAHLQGHRLVLRRLWHRRRRRFPHERSDHDCQRRGPRHVETL